MVEAVRTGSGSDDMVDTGVVVIPETVVRGSVDKVLSDGIIRVDGAGGVGISGLEAANSLE